MSKLVRSAICKPLTNQKGVTLLEVMVTLMIFIMITVILNAFLVMGMSMFSKITKETQIRNQADMVYSQIIAELQDALYIESVMDEKSNLALSTNRIRYVKRPQNNSETQAASEFLIRYEMREEKDSGGQYIAVYRLNGKGLDANEVKRFSINNFAFTMTPRFNVFGDDQVLVKLKFEPIDTNVARNEKPASLEIESMIKIYKDS